MKLISYLLIGIISLSACDLVFRIKETKHSISVENQSEYDLELISAIDESVDTLFINSGEDEGFQFWNQYGDYDPLTEVEVFDHFDALTLIIKSENEVLKEIDFKSLQKPFIVGTNHFMSTSSWIYNFSVTDEDLK